MEENKNVEYKIKYIYPPSPTTMRGYGMNLTYSSAKQKIAYCSSNLIILRSFENFTECEIFNEHKSETTACRFNSSGTMICSGDIKGSVFIFETFSPFPIRKTFPNILSDRINDVAWTSDSQRIAVVGNGKQMFGKVFLVDTGSSVGEITAVSKMINCVDFRPQRPFRMWLGGEDFRVSYYEGPPFKFKKYIKEHKNFVNCVRFDQSGKVGITVSSDKTIFVGDGQTGEKICEYQSEHTGSIMSCSFFQNEGNAYKFATASNDKTVRIWKLEENQVQQICKLLPVDKATALDNMFVGVHVCVNQKKEEVVIAVDFSGRLCLWQSLKDESEPDVAMIGHQYFGKIKRPSLQKARDIMIPLLLQKQHYQSIKNSFIPQPRMGFQSKQIQKKNPICNLIIKFYLQISMEIQSQELLLDMVPSKVSEQNFYILTETEIKSFQGTENKKNIKLDFVPTVIEITAKDQFFIVGSQAGDIYIIEAETGNITQKLPMYGRKITAVCISPDNKSFAAGDNNYKILLWSLTNFQVLTDMFCYHTGMITSLSYSQSGKYLLSTSIDCKLCVWNCQTYSKEMEILNLHKNGIFCGVFNNEGEVITGGGDNLIKVIEGNEKFQ